MDIPPSYVHRRNDIVRTMRSDPTLVNWPLHLEQMTSYLRDFVQECRADDCEMRFAYANILCQKSITLKMDGSLSSLDAIGLQLGLSELRKCVQSNNVLINDFAKKYVGKVAQVLIREDLISGEEYQEMARFAQLDNANALLWIIADKGRTSAETDSHEEGHLIVLALRAYSSITKREIPEHYLLPVIKWAAANKITDITDPEARDYITQIKDGMSWKGHCVWASVLYQHNDYVGTIDKLQLARIDLEKRISQGNDTVKIELRAVKSNVEASLIALHKEAAVEMYRSPPDVTKLTFERLNDSLEQVLSINPLDCDALLYCARYSFNHHEWLKSYTYLDTVLQVQDETIVEQRGNLVTMHSYAWHKSKPEESSKIERARIHSLNPQDSRLPSTSELVLQLHDIPLNHIQVTSCELRKKYFGYDPFEYGIFNLEKNIGPSRLLGLINNELKQLVGEQLKLQPTPMKKRNLISKLWGRQ